MENPAVTDSLIVCENSQGFEIRATVLRLTRHLVVFEICTPFVVLQMSEALTHFRISLHDRIVYSGRAVVSGLINTGTLLVCDATLEESWLDVDTVGAPEDATKLRAEFDRFLRLSQGAFHIRPDFKIVVADMQMHLLDLRRWFEQIELSVLSQPSGSRQVYERHVIEKLQVPILPLLFRLFERFEEACKGLEPDLQPAHRAYVRRQLHPLVLCAPFMYRTFQKPLGYAGDYEMVDMMMRDPWEGGSIFAKVLNTFFLSTPPVVAHRNRIEYLKANLAQEAARAIRLGRGAKIFNLGCGPAREIQDFIAQSELSERAQITLLDFNDETLQHTGQVLNQIKERNHRGTTVQMVKKAVAQVIKEAGKPNSTLLSSDYDLVYCAGLFDYMPDYICEKLMAIFYHMLAPGGLLIATNVDESNPSRNWMEYSVDWNLIYRNRNKMVKIAPAKAPPDSYRILAEATGVNTFIEVRKPAHA